MTHIENFSFCGLRRLNQFTHACARRHALQTWMQSRTVHHCSKVNVIIGANGSGKSTLIDFLDFLRDPARIVTLPRENRPSESFAAFNVCFANGNSLTGASNPNFTREIQSAPNVTGEDSWMAMGLELSTEVNGNKKAFERNVSKKGLDPVTLSELVNFLAPLDANCEYWAGNVERASQVWADELNAARNHLVGVLSEVDLGEETKQSLAERLNGSWWLLPDGRLAVTLSDETAQPSHVRIEELPAGWRKLASFLGWLRNVPRGSICLVEEPETHLHPRLQRYLAERTGEIAKTQNLQVFIATHSPVFQQLNVWPHGAKLFVTRDGELSELNTAWEVLDDLGIKNSDLSQSNGIIWIEGPSDRIYIKHWIKLYCTEQGFRMPQENVDYSFAMYGGASLSHFSFDNAAPFIDMLSINRNAIIVMDRDNDFVVDDYGCEVVANPALAKAKITNWLESKGQERAYAWVTDGYTIESYLPEKFLENDFFEENCRLILKENRNKVAIATRYAKQDLQFKTCSRMKILLDFHIARLVASIAAWNR